MYWFVFHDSKLLLEKTASALCTIPQGDMPPVTIGQDVCVHNVTAMEDGTPVKTFDTDEPLPSDDGFETVTLREAYHKLSLPLYLKAGKCQEILYWDKNTRFCGVCGAPMKLHTDISKRCTMCGKEVWPSLATAVITLISRGDDIMLVHARNFSGDYYGLVAGFVETGESLEEAVVREIHEEVGLEVKNLHYVMSQPWPYPCGLMIGFTAEYVSGEVKLQESELSTGGWFNKDNLPPLPDKSGIARRMVDAWRKRKR